MGNIVKENSVFLFGNTIFELVPAPQATIGCRLYHYIFNYSGYRKDFYDDIGKVS